MIIDRILSRLLSEYVTADLKSFRIFLLDDSKVTALSEEAGKSRGEFYDAIAFTLATGFQSKAFDFGFCDQIVNELHNVITVQNENRPELFWDVYLAFDAGEYYHDNDRSIDPVEAFTRPRIAEIVKNLPFN
jgi:hypothetical protein